MKISKLLGYAGIGMAFTIALSSCSSDPDPLVYPDNYTTSNYDNNVTAESSIITDLNDLVNAMKSATSSNPVSASTLTSIYNGSDLAAATTSYYHSKLTGWMTALANASSDGTYDPFASIASNGQGGFYGNRLFDAYGIELQQLIEKGLFEAALYNHALSVMNGSSFNANSVDKLVKIIGAHPDFVNSDNASLHTNADKFAAKYAAQRDKNDGNGFYTNIKKALIKTKTAIEAGEEYNDVRDASLVEFRNNWEKSCMATVIYYLKSAISKLSATNPTETDIASALHSYGEGIGFVHGWYGINQSHKIITDAEVTALLADLKAPLNGNAAAADFVTGGASALADLQHIIDEIQAIYGFSNQEVADFGTNWVSAQAR